MSYGAMTYTRCSVRHSFPTLLAASKRQAYSNRSPYFVTLQIPPLTTENLMPLSGTTALNLVELAGASIIAWNRLLKFYKKDITYRRENFRMSKGPRPEGGRRPDNDGAPKPAMGQGRPHKDAFGMGPGGSKGPGMGNPPSERTSFQDVDMEQLEKYNLKQDKKLRRIIGDENFQAWRAAHPQEMPKLPDIELK